MEKYKYCVLDFLELINKYEQEDGGNIFKQNDKTNDDEIAIFQKWLSQYTNNECSEYIEFIKIINGFTFGPSEVYSLNCNSSCNIYKENEAICKNNEKLRQYIFFCTDDINLYGINVKTGKHCRYNLFTNEFDEDYETFYELMARQLEVSLYSGDDGNDEEYEKIKWKNNIDEKIGIYEIKSIRK